MEKIYKPALLVKDWTIEQLDAWQAREAEKFLQRTKCAPTPDSATLVDFEPSHDVGDRADRVGSRQRLVFQALIDRVLPVHVAHEFLDWFAQHTGAGKVEIVRATEKQRQIRVTCAIGDRFHGVAEDENDAKAIEMAMRNAVQSLLCKEADLWAQFQATRQGKELTSININGEYVDLNTAMAFIKWYCNEHSLGPPCRKHSVLPAPGRHAAVLSIRGRDLGFGEGADEYAARAHCYLDAARLLATQDEQVWQHFRTHVGALHDRTIIAQQKAYWKPSKRLMERLSCVANRQTDTLLYKQACSTASDETSGIHQIASEAFQFVIQKPEIFHQARLIHLPPPVSERERERWSDSKQRRLRLRQRFIRTLASYSTIRREYQKLPVWRMAKSITRLIKENWFSILVADPGSGKTTMVPQIILDNAIKDGRGSETNILITQPHRVAALSVAAFVAKARSENIGDSVGYLVRGASRVPEMGGSITFTTIGSILRMMATSPNKETQGSLLDHCTHLIVDEAHCRDVLTNVTLAMLKRLVVQRASTDRPLRVVVMCATCTLLGYADIADRSATLDTKDLAMYLKHPVTNAPATVLRINHRLWNVRHQYLEQLIVSLRSRYPDSAAWDDVLVREYLQQESNLEQNLPLVATPFNLLALAVDYALTLRSSGDCLVFLPDIDAIIQLKAHLLGQSGCVSQNIENYGDKTRYEIFIMHSTIPLAEQQLVFRPPEKGVRRIVLSTDVCESAVTVPGISAVVDTGRTKEQVYNPLLRKPGWSSAWIGRDNLLLRAGRAGRSSPGDYLSLISDARVNVLLVRQPVEMDMVDLSDVVLLLKGFNLPAQPAVILRHCMAPPTTERINAAIRSLQDLGALDSKEELTAMGSLVSFLSISARVGAAVLLGLVFRCLGPATTLGLISGTTLFQLPPEHKIEAERMRTKWSPPNLPSDGLAGVAVFEAWDALEGDARATMSLVRENFLDFSQLASLRGYRNLLLRRLAAIGALSTAGTFDMSASFASRGQMRVTQIPKQLGLFSDSLPILNAIIAFSARPYFALQGFRGQDTIFSVTSSESQSLVSNRSADNGPPQRYDHRDMLDDKDSVFENQPIKPCVSQIISCYDLHRVMPPRISDPWSDERLTLRTTSPVDILNFLLFGARTLDYKRRGDQYEVLVDKWMSVSGNIGLENIIKLHNVLAKVLPRVFESLAKQVINDGRGLKEVTRSLVNSDDDDAPGEHDQSAVEIYFSRREMLGELNGQENQELAQLINDIQEILQMAYEEHHNVAQESSADSMHLHSEDESYIAE